MRGFLSSLLSLELFLGVESASISQHLEARTQVGLIFRIHVCSRTRLYISTVQVRNSNARNLSYGSSTVFISSHACAELFMEDKTL